MSSIFRQCARRKLIDLAIFRSCRPKPVSTHLARGSYSVGHVWRLNTRRGISGPVIIALVADA
jgi:hypothetical protein